MSFEDDNDNQFIVQHVFEPNAATTGTGLPDVEEIEESAGKRQDRDRVSVTGPDEFDTKNMGSGLNRGKSPTRAVVTQLSISVRKSANDLNADISPSQVKKSTLNFVDSAANNKES